MRRWREHLANADHETRWIYSRTILSWSARSVAALNEGTTIRIVSLLV